MDRSRHGYYAYWLDNKQYFGRKISEQSWREGVCPHVWLCVDHLLDEYARVSGEMIETLACNDQLCRLPLWPGLTDKQVGDVVALVFEAFHENS